jgi:hypothetical protein
MGPASAKLATVQLKLAEMRPHNRFSTEMFGPLWDAAMFYGIDPVVMIAQSYKETGGGAYGGAVQSGFFNPCGLKNYASFYPGVDDGDRPLAHARFPNWKVGAMAHAQHLRAYAGVPLPLDSLIVSPRYFLVTNRTPTGAVEELSTRWAPSATYGAEIVAIAKRLGSTG